jgi:hypothetical protein
MFEKLSTWTPDVGESSSLHGRLYRRRY